MKAKVFFLSLTMITTGFLTSVAQNNFPLQDRLNQRNANFEYPDNETPNFPMLKKTKSGQDWWEPDTVYFFVNASGTFEKTDLVYRNIYKYSLQGLLSEIIKENWENNSWVITYKVTYTYDSNNNRINLQSQNWENNSWVNNNLFTYTYDSSNNMLSWQLQRMENNLWINSYLFTYTYDSKNNLLTELRQVWNNNSWINSYLYTYTYTCDSNNNLLTEQLQVWSNNSWVGNIIFSYTYDSNNNKLTRLQQEWSNNSWVDGNLFTYTYDSNNNLLSTFVNLKNNSLINFIENRMTYDENNNCISTESWWCVNESWQPSLNAYMSDMYRINLCLYYNNMQSVFEEIYCDKMTASYIKVSDISTTLDPIAVSELNDISIYPNPTDGELRIRNYELGIENVQVFDIYGIKQLSTFNFQFSNQIDISHLPAGIYFVRITTEKGVVTKKVVKK